MRYASKMLRQMESGEPVKVDLTFATMTRLTRLAFIAEQFGYEYADVWQGGGPQGNGYVMLIVPDPSPEARARAELNRAQYPDAANGGALPPLVPEAVALLKARLTFDITARLTETQMVLISGFTLLLLVLPLGFGLREGTDALVLAGAIWAVLMLLIPVGIAVNRHYKAKYAAILQAAGFRPVTDPNGRLRYVPPGGQLPGGGAA
ncbi:hypothetical protein [Streptomyces sp. RFCAC02]|uniref:hypothetical protein n=1 Tax=Streptomyces sp. RFCAC02 TaxID=2499143 RepID=UPI00102015B8|nr:hypothetical protein [Streptomyces sp. RFCAC02]